MSARKIVRIVSAEIASIGAKGMARRVRWSLRTEISCEARMVTDMSRRHGADLRSANTQLDVQFWGLAFISDSLKIGGKQLLT